MISPLPFPGSANTVNTAPPAFLSPEEVTRVLAAPDRSTPTGRRDYAILLLLARLGLRAGEIVSLELDDIHWRDCRNRRSRQRPDSGPVAPFVRGWRSSGGCTLREDRGVSSSRRVFLRIWAPAHRSDRSGGCGSHCAISPRPSRGSPLRSGCCPSVPSWSSDQNDSTWRLSARNLRGPPASFTETTSIYTQVAFETLRTVAQPWPSTGGVR